jgi:hypothetical protein
MILLTLQGYLTYNEQGLEKYLNLQCGNPHSKIKIFFVTL